MPGSFLRASCGFRKASDKQRTTYCTAKLVGQTCGRRKREGWFEYLHAHRFPWGRSMLKPLKPLNKSNLGHIGLGCAAPASVRGRALLCMYFVVCSCATENLGLENDRNTYQFVRTLNPVTYHVIVATPGKLCKARPRSRHPDRFCRTTRPTHNNHWVRKNKLDDGLMPMLDGYSNSVNWDKRTPCE